MRVPSRLAYTLPQGCFTQTGQLRAPVRLACTLPQGGATHAPAPATRRSSFLSQTRTLAPHARSKPPCGAASHARAADMRRTCSYCFSLPHPPGLMRALAPYARSGPPCVCTPAAGHFACTSTCHALDQLSHCLSLSHPLGLVYAGSLHTRAPGRHHTCAPSSLACTLPPGRFTQTGQHVCMCPESTLGSSSHVRALATRRTSFLSLSLSFFHQPGLIFARLHARPGQQSILNGSLAQTISLFAPKLNLSNSSLCTISSPHSNITSLFNSSYQQYYHRAEHGSVHHHSMGAVCPAHIQVILCVLEESFSVLSSSSRYSRTWIFEDISLLCQCLAWIDIVTARMLSVQHKYKR